MNGVLDALVMSSWCWRLWVEFRVSDGNLLAMLCAAASGLANVSGASEDRRPRRLLRRLFPLPFDCGRGPV